MNPGSASLLELLAQDGSVRFIIPPWRRNYNWGTTSPGPREVERLWQDLLSKCDVDKKYFCGIILLHKLQMEDVPTWEIVDGQQRIATLFLLLMALRDACEKRGVDCTDLNNLLKAADSADCRLALHGGLSTDRRVMNTLLKRTGFTLDQKIQEESKVYLAYRYLVAQIESEIPSGSQEFLVSILQGVEFKLQTIEPTEQTRHAFATLDARSREASAREAASEKPAKIQDKPPVARAPFRLSKKMLAMVGGGLGLVAILCLVGVLCWWYFTGAKTAYYQEVTSHYGVPEGVLKLSASQAQNRAFSYRIEKDKGRISRVTKINGTGHPVDDPAMHQASTGEIHYGDNGEVAQVVYLNHYGREVFREIYNALPDNLAGGKRGDISFKTLQRSASASQPRNFELLGEEIYTPGNGIDAKLDITGEIVDYTPDGRPQQIQFHNSSGKPRSNTNGVFAQSFEYNPARQVTKISNLGRDGKPAQDKHGIASVVQTFDASGNQIDEAWLDLNGQPMLNKYGYAKVTFKCDDQGNKIEVIFFDVAGKPVYSKEGFARLTAKYDAHGNLIEQSCFGLNGEPVLTHDGYSTEMLKYDDGGNVIEANYLDADGKPMINKNGFATGKLKYDARGNITEKACFGIDGKPVLNKDGFATESLKYDDNDNVIEIDGLGLDGLPILGSSGYARAVFKYNSQGDKIEADYFDNAGQPTLNKDGYAIEIFEYDDRGDVTSQSYQGVDGHPVMNRDGVAKLTAKYNERGNLLETLCFGPGGQPTLDENGVARETYTYDDWDNTISASCFGVDNQPVLDRGGVASAVFKYDSQGNKLEANYYGLDGKPVLNTGGFARELFKYDERGNMIGGSYFGASGLSILGPNGFASEILKYDERDRVIEGTCFGIEDQPIEVGGAHRIVYTYDSTGKISKADRFDSTGQAVH
jgi:hypothetical protein